MEDHAKNFKVTSYKLGKFVQFRHTVINTWLTLNLLVCNESFYPKPEIFKHILKLMTSLAIITLG